MSNQINRKFHVIGIIERHDNHVLIVLPKDEARASRLWQFPRGPAREKETPESAMRRVVKERLDVEIDIVVGQPPVSCEIDEEEVEARCFFCGIVSGEPTAEAYAEVRWVSRIHLREYDFDAPTMIVVEWLLESGGT